MVYDLRCIYIGNEPSFALETKVRDVSNNINRSLIGNILKSIRVEKNIPMKKIASALKVSESTVSQIETGKNSATKEKINEICHVCGCSFDYKTDREKMIEIGINSFTNNELAIYYDMQGLKYIYSKNSIKAVKFLEKSISFNSNFLMNNYHHCTIYLNLGYYNLAQIFINKSLKIALEDVMIERLFHLLLNQASLYINTLQYQEADRINLKLLEESYVRNDLFLRYCVLSNLTLSSLLKKDFNDGFVYIGMIDQKYLNDDYDLILYQIMLYFFSNDYISTKNHIRKALGNTSISSYYKNFFQGIKYLMDNKFIKAIDRIESCYNLALTAGEVDRAMLVLKLLNELYLDHGLQNKLRKVKKLQENFYKMSYANQIIEDIELKLN